MNVLKYVCAYFYKHIRIVCVCAYGYVHVLIMCNMHGCIYVCDYIYVHMHGLM